MINSVTENQPLNNDNHILDSVNLVLKGYEKVASFSSDYHKGEDEGTDVSSDI